MNAEQWATALIIYVFGVFLVGSFICMVENGDGWFFGGLFWPLHLLRALYRSGKAWWRS